MKREDIARRKSLLAAQAHLQRIQARLAWHDVMEVVSPPHLTPARGDRARSIAAVLIGIAVPVFGLPRLGRILRTFSIGMMIMRIVRGLRGRHN
jgi:hypothetical protein